MSVKVKLDNPQKLQKDIKNYFKKVGLSTGEALDVTAFQIHEEAINILGSQKTNNTGHLAQNITVSKPSDGTMARRVGTETGYGLYVEFGRPPGKPPPIKQWTGREEELDRWVKRKLGLRGKAAKTAAWFIALKIGERGTKPQPFLRPAFERTKKRLILNVRKELAKNAKS